MNEKIVSLVADRFIAELEKGVAPWARGFNYSGPMNAFSKKGYRGVNYFLLAFLGVDFALTYKQAAEMGGNVKKGAKGIPVVFWKPYDRKPKAGEPVDEKARTGFMMRYYTVFALADTEGVKFTPPEAKGANNERIATAEALFAKLESVGGFSVVNGGNLPCYSPGMHRIAMPQFDRWAQPARFYKTLFHECAHALASKTGKKLDTHFGSDAYAAEELVAELFASVCLAHLGIDSADAWDNSVAYVQGWATKLGKEPKTIISAAQECQKRIDLVFGAPKVESEESED